jgi:glycosyltransferase involved in cell wall biosynthesis
VALAEALEQLASDPKLAAEMGAAARRDVELFSYDRMVAAFEAAMTHAVEKRAGHVRADTRVVA